ncbi:MAG: GNAT family N-acetyltransferase, partial [Gammaproteobacteria bacterium]
VTQFLGSWSDCLWLGSCTDSGDAHPPSSASRFLGQEFNAVVYDMHAGFNPDAFGAIAGTIRDGGLLVLLAPPLESWKSFDDPEYARIDTWSPDEHRFAGHYLGYLRQILLAQPDLPVIRQGTQDPVPAFSEPPPREPRTTGDQQAAIEEIIHTARGHARRPLVMTADRGRGKSAALGMAAARLLTETPRRILVTAPRRSAVETLFRHATEALPGAELIDGNLLQHGDGRVQFLPPDLLLRSAPQADLLLIDEAAAIPATLLKGLLLRYNRIVFSTTVHGYEGTGRGFAIRFRQTLDEETPQWRELTLDEPVRWQSGDTLEALVSRALLLDAEPAAAASLEGIDPRSLSIARISRSGLLSDRRLLEEVFGLLVSAHYQTRPFDLRHMLDAPGVEILLARHGSSVGGVLLTVSEGGFDNALAREILAGKRRVRGNLAPQSLGLHLQDDAFLRARFRRVMRIAVHPALQRGGLGQRMLETVAQSGDADLLATSFGATAGLVRFWRASGFTPARIGMRRDAASGSHSLLMLRALKETANPLQLSARERFDALLPLLLLSELEELESDMVCELLLNPEAAETKTLTKPLLERLRRFTEFGLPLDTALPELEALVRHAASRGMLGRLPSQQRALLAGLFLQRQRPQQIVRSLGISGKGEMLSLLARAVDELLPSSPGSG